MPKQKQTIYLAYGSNLNLRQMAYRCPTAVPIGTTELKGYDLKFRGGDGNAIATVEPGEGCVPALLWTLKQADEQALNQYEGCPHFYRKETVAVELGSKTVSAMLYVMNDGHELGRPSKYYFNTILEGYDDVGLDKNKLYEAARFLKDMMMSALT